MNKDPRSQSLVLVARGTRSWDELSELGISIKLGDENCEVTNRAGISATLGAPDVAAGILAHEHDPVKLRRWAWLLLSADVFDLRLDDAPGAVLLDALWDLAHGKPLDSRTRATAQSLM